jgi:hypothetical protein
MEEPHGSSNIDKPSHSVIYFWQGPNAQSRQYLLHIGRPLLLRAMGVERKRSREITGRLNFELEYAKPPSEWHVNPIQTCLDDKRM